MPSGEAGTHGQSAAFKVGVAMAGIAAMVLVQSLSWSWIDPVSQFLLLGTIVIAIAWLGGSAPALLAIVAGAVAGALDPLVAGDARATHTHLALFIIQSLLLTLLVTQLRHARVVAEQQLSHAQAARRESEGAGRTKDEFLAIISHELRTPLNAVLGWLHLLRTGKLDEATTKRGLEAIERNVRLQARLTGDLLDVSKVLTGQLRLESRPISLSDAARQAVLTATPIAEAKGVHVQLSIPDAAVPVLGDATRLRQVAWHLLSNAIKFTPRGGTVSLTVECAADTALLTVQDSGPGIDPVFLPRVFDRFSQEDPSATRAAGGLGVGLSLVRDLVEMHGGEIRARNRVASESAADGATFVARFPLHACEPETRAPLLATLSHAPLDGVRVLVLDQEADGREFVRTLLQQRGALVRTADSVAEALEALEAWQPDVLVSDSATPDHESYSLVGKVRSLDVENGGRIPATALTTFARTDLRARRMIEAFHRDVPKPVEAAVLAAEVARLAGRERRRVQRAH